MWLNNTDEEVKCFHPVCKEALEAALKQLGLADKYEVQHHRSVDSIQMDLAVANKATNKILCVVEVKRTVSAVNSTRYQYQAMSYVQSLSDAELESPYYLLTNLEASCLFKYDSTRKNVYEQILKPGIKKNHLFREVTKDTFMHDLIQQYADYLNEIINDNGEYLRSFSTFADELSQKFDNELQWKKALVGLMYEYIRGSFTKIGRKELKTIGQLSNKIDLVCREGLKVNFKDIFTLPSLTGREREIDTSRSLLEELFDLGRTYVDADELAGVMHKIISNGHEHEGEVPTDSELANIMLWLVKGIGGELKPDEKIMDPAAGGGSLVCAAVDVLDNIQPNQIIANDVNSHLLQLLSLRLGLKFATTITPQNTATIYAKNITELDKGIFEGVKYIVMNPPFLAATGKHCPERKEQLYKRIRELKGSFSVTLKGQMPLECVFIELVATLAKDGTIMGVIIPNTHLTTKGDASVAFRKMLLDVFGLQVIFSYPQENLFEGVTQNTLIIIGVKGSTPENVKYIHCNNAISDVNQSSIVDVLRKPFESDNLHSLNNDFEGCNVSSLHLQEVIEEGWMIGNIIQQEARNFLDGYLCSLPLMQKIEASEFSDFYRGKIGNNGCIDLLFLHDNSYLIRKHGQSISSHLFPGLNNSDYNNYEVGGGDSYFFNVSGFSDEELELIVSDFISNAKKKKGKQRRDKKTVEDCEKLLRRESKRKIIPTFSVLLPRGQRSEGRIFRTTEPLYVSTNFFVFELTEEKSYILSSWMSSVFFQLECEAYVNNRVGLRKLEKADYMQMHVPNVDLLSTEEKEAIKRTAIQPFLNLRQPLARPTDEIWAKILFKEDAKERLDEAVGLLAMLVAARER